MRTFDPVSGHLPVVVFTASYRDDCFLVRSIGIKLSSKYETRQKKNHLNNPPKVKASCKKCLTFCLKLHDIFSFHKIFSLFLGRRMPFNILLIFCTQRNYVMKNKIVRVCVN